MKEKVINDEEKEEKTQQTEPDTRHILLGDDGCFPDGYPFVAISFAYFRH